MTTSDPVMVEFVRYNNWANRQILDACQKLTGEQLELTAPGNFGTIRHTVEHIVRSEAGYLRMLAGDAPQPPFDWEDKPPVADIAAYAARVGDALLDAVSHISPTEPVRRQWRGGRTLVFQAQVLVIQIVDHGIEHRVNITTILAAANLAHPDVDGWRYLVDHAERLAVAS